MQHLYTDAKDDLNGSFVRAYTLAYICFGCGNSFRSRNILFQHLKVYKCTMKRRPSRQNRKLLTPHATKSTAYANKTADQPMPSPDNLPERILNAPPLELGTEKPPKHQPGWFRKAMNYLTVAAAATAPLTSVFSPAPTPLPALIASPVPINLWKDAGPIVDPSPKEWMRIPKRNNWEPQILGGAQLNWDNSYPITMVTSPSNLVYDRRGRRSLLEPGKLSRYKAALST